MMKLGLIRHYKVITNEKKFLSTQEFVEAMKRYDVAPVSENGLILNSTDWDICYCSTLPRAVSIAEKIFDGKIIIFATNKNP